LRAANPEALQLPSGRTSAFILNRNADAQLIDSPPLGGNVSVEQVPVCDELRLFNASYSKKNQIITNH
jgi:hypothetical protein